MKYKALVMGKYVSVIDDFFIQMGDDLEVVSCSTRYGDIIRHIKYFMPEVLVYCLNNEDPESMKQMVNIKPMLKDSRTPVVIIGTKEDCLEFNKLAINVSDMDLMRPFTSNSIRDSIVRYLDKRRAEQEEYEKKMAEHNKVPAYEESMDSKFEDVDIDSLKNALSSLDAALHSIETPNPQKANDVSAVKTAPVAKSNGRKHILVVDDDPIMLKTVKEQLNDDYDVATAISGKIAMKFLERKTTDLILLDYEMPGENGPDVLGKIRGNDSTKNIPVVFLTGVSDREKIQEAIALKPQGYLLKPIDHDKLMESIHNTLG